MNRFTLLALPFAFVGLVACGPNHDWTLDPEAESRGDDGTIDGARFQIVGAIARFRTAQNGTKQLEILLSDKPIRCDAPVRGGSRTVVVTTSDARGEGTFAIVDASVRSPLAGEASADTYAVDAACRPAKSSSATNGSVTLVPGDVRYVSGKLDVTLRQGKVAGSFAAAVCEPLPDAACAP